MIVNVRLKDGRTTFQFASRKDFQNALGQNPEQEQGLVRQRCWVKHYVDDLEWSETTVLFINKSSVEYAVDASSMEDYGLPAQEVADERKRMWEAREAADEA